MFGKVKVKTRTDSSHIQDPFPNTYPAKALAPCYGISDVHRTDSHHTLLITAMTWYNVMLHQAEHMCLENFHLLLSWLYPPSVFTYTPELQY